MLVGAAAETRTWATAYLGSEIAFDLNYTQIASSQTVLTATSAIRCTLAHFCFRSVWAFWRTALGFLERVLAIREELKALRCLVSGILS